jgi:hypothetical protein
MTGDGEHVDFWKGVVVGTLVGLVAAAYAKGEFNRLLSFNSSSEESLFEPDHAFRGHAKELQLRREAAENAGDPTRLSSQRSMARMASPVALTIERPGGAPGPGSAPEILEVPGQPGRLIDHSDAAQHLQSAVRTHNLTPN